MNSKLPHLVHVDALAFDGELEKQRLGAHNFVP